jgi:Uma2 family endonuclease
MIELNEKLRTIDLPYSIRLYGVSEKAFDAVTDEDTRAELIDGVMVVHSPASLDHDNVSGFLRSLMRIYAAEKNLGMVLGPESLVRLAPGRKVAPDLYFLGQKRVPRRLPRKQFNGVPDLVVEVLSPSNRAEELNEKRPIYRKAGVREIWLVDPKKQQVLVDRRRRAGYSTATTTEGRVVSSVLAGFWIEAGWLWVESLPNEMTCLVTILGHTIPP